jgi:hypothetical protein
MENFTSLKAMAEKIVRISNFMRDEGMEGIWEGDFFTIANEDDEPYCGWEVKVTDEYVVLNGRLIDIDRVHSIGTPSTVITLVSDIITEFGQEYFNGALALKMDFVGVVG